MWFGDGVNSQKSRTMENYWHPLHDKLHSLGNKDDALAMSAYMKNRFEFYGVKSPQRKAVLKEHWSVFGLPKAGQFEQTILEGWEYDEREMQYCTMEVLLRSKKVWPEDMSNLLTRLITSKSWWDTVDFLAGSVVYQWCLRQPHMVEAITRDWSKSSEMWLNRSAILFQLKAKTETRVDLLAEYILPHIDSSEFFHQKAIGWALRQYGKFNPDWVTTFVESHDLKPLSEREAMRVIRKSK